MNWPRAVLLLSAAASTCLPQPLPSPGLPPGQFPCKRRDLSLHHCLQTQPNFTARGSPGKFASPFSEAQKEDCTAPTPQCCREGFNSCKRRRLIAWHQDALEARSHTNAGFLQIYATWHATRRETMRLHKMLKTQQVSSATALKPAIAHCKAHTQTWTHTHVMHVGLALYFKNAPKCIFLIGNLNKVR